MVTKTATVQTEAPSTQTATDEQSDTREEIPKDELFHVLQNERRRRVLTYLLDRDGPFEMRSIAEQVAAWEHDTTVRQLMSDERQRVYIALYQSHLPKLDEVGLIHYEQKRGTVEPTPLLETVSQYVDSPEDIDSNASEDTDTDRTDSPDEALSRERTYVAATAMSLLLTGAVWLQVIPMVSGMQLALVVTALFALTTTSFAWRRGDPA